ncbi:MAG: 30S ribosomal protein S17 [Candidatus Neomarinimicrobiota bacterium]
MNARGKKQVLEGRVVSDKMEKTVLVEVFRRFRHPVYGKYVRKKKKYAAHVENQECRAGDTVRIISSRPISKRKRWRVIEVIRKAKGS